MSQLRVDIVVSPRPAPDPMGWLKPVLPTFDEATVAASTSLTASSVRTPSRQGLQAWRLGWNAGGATQVPLPVFMAIIPAVYRPRPLRTPAGTILEIGWVNVVTGGATFDVALWPAIAPFDAQPRARPLWSSAFSDAFPAPTLPAWSPPAEEEGTSEYIVTFRRRRR